MNTVVSVASVASASAIASPSVVAEIVGEADPAFAAVERVRAARAKLDEAILAHSRLEESLPESITRAPRILRNKTDATQGYWLWDRDIEAERERSMKLMLEVNRTSNSEPELLKCVHAINDWAKRTKARLRADAARQKRRQAATGFSASLSREVQAIDEHEEAYANLAATIPTTLAGATAMLDWILHVVFDLNSSSVGEEDEVVLRTVKDALDRFKNDL